MIPEELKKLPQWAVSASSDDKAPRNPRTGELASVRDPSTWGTYAEAEASGYPLIGFILTREDPYAFIDLDKPLDDVQAQRQMKVYEASANTYAELSQSGVGVHIICKGSIPHGVRRDRIEVYSSERYMIMTGDTIRDLPVEDCQPLLDVLYNEMSFGHGASAEYELTDEAETRTDEEIVDIASGAVNGEKFDALCAGDWEGAYPSQSEADYALINILAFYTRSTEQVMRLFRMSALGKREKAWRDDYIIRMLKKIRSQEPEPIDFAHLLNGNGTHTNSVLSPLPAVPPYETNGHKSAVVTGPGRRLDAPAHPLRGGAGSDEAAPGSGVPDDSNGRPGPRPAPPLAPVAPRRVRGSHLPPGFVGEIARYLYETSSRPVAEVATASALALVAGVVGRQYNISATGLNLYLILLAKTGVGKEEAARGIDRIVSSLRNTIPVVDQFIGPGTFASGPAVIRTLDERPCFVSILGEFGLTLQALSDVNASPHSVVLRRVLLDVYGKSGRNNALRSSAYADKEKNTKVVFSPALTLFGESTPETFYGGLSLSMVADGLIPRFLITEYKGDRPERNRTPYAPPSESLTQRFGDLVSTVLQMQANNSWYDVRLDAAAQAALDDFDGFCDAHIRAGEAEGVRQLWNRTHLIALKLAGVLAVANNPADPIVTEVEARWAIDHARESAERIAERFETGDVGESDQKVNLDIRRLLQQYVDSEFESVERYGVTRNLHEARVVPAVYLQRRTAGLAAFRKHKLGANAALREAVRDLLEADVLVEIPKKQMQEKFNTGQRAFWVKL